MSVAVAAQRLPVKSRARNHRRAATSVDRCCCATTDDTRNLLPQVWDELPGNATVHRHLLRKAGHRELDSAGWKSIATPSTRSGNGAAAMRNITGASGPACRIRSSRYGSRTGRRTGFSAICVRATASWRMERAACAVRQNQRRTDDPDDVRCSSGFGSGSDRKKPLSHFYPA